MDLSTLQFMKEKLLENLNAPQKQAVSAPLGNLLVLAGPGSGKTRVLVNRIAWLIEHENLSPYEILAVTFTNKGAGEMKGRLSQLLNRSLFGVWLGTFHSLCHRMLRQHYQAAKLPQAFQVLDSDDQLRLIKKTIINLGLDESQWPAKQAQSFINNWKDQALRPKEVPLLSYGPTKVLISVYQAYEQACQIAGVIDFAELILRAYELLRFNPDLLNHYQQRFKIISVDEFQDINTMQYLWLSLLAKETIPITAVGDDDQSIYGWRGAKIEIIHRFSQDFKDAKIIRLEQNYRSTPTIVAAANSLINHNPSRMGKKVWTDAPDGEKIIVYNAYNEIEEARFVSERVAMALQQYSAQDIAVLYRSNVQSRVLEEALIRLNIAYRIYGGLRFFERAEVKDCLAYLRLLANRNDDTAFERIVNFPTRGIGEKTLQELRYLAKIEQISLWQAAQKVLEDKKLPSRAALMLNQFILLIERLSEQMLEMELDKQLLVVIQGSGLFEHFAKMKNDKSESRLENLQELVSAAKQFCYENEEEEEIPLLTAFLSHASLEAGEMQAADDKECVQLMTLHAAKGLEFPIVFLVGLEEGVFPSRQSVDDPNRLEEERRLCYVGLTRAKKHLILTYAEVRRQYGREEYHAPSRFLKELPETLIESIRIKSLHNQKSTSMINCETSKPNCDLNLGKNVVHKLFGAGTILNVEGIGTHTRVQVKFNNPLQGTKWLVLSYANLIFDD